MRRSIAAFSLVAAVLTTSPAAAADKVDPEASTGHDQPTVTVTIDAEGELRETIARYLNQQLSLYKNITVVDESADWSILVSALEPEMDEKGPKRYVMATVFSEQLRWVDPAIVDELGKSKGYLAPERLKHYADTQKKLGRLYIIRVSEGKRGALAKACAQIIRDFNMLCVRPRSKALAVKPAPPASGNTGSVAPRP